MIEIGKRDLNKSLPLVCGLGRSRSHLKDSFQGSWRRLKTDEEDVECEENSAQFMWSKAVVFCRQEIVLNSVARLRWALKLWAPRKRSKKLKHPFCASPSRSDICSSVACHYTTWFAMSDREFNCKLSFPPKRNLLTYTWIANDDLSLPKGTVQ